MKIAMVFPYAPSYREPIYQLMDKSFDIDWYFCGNATRNMNCPLPKKQKRVRHKTFGNNFFL